MTDGNGKVVVILATALAVCAVGREVVELLAP